MDSINERPIQEDEDKSPYIPEITAHKIESTVVAEQGSGCGGLCATNHKTLRAIVYRSIRTVVFSNRLNLLIPFGPLAILVQKLTNHHVSCSSISNNSSISCCFL